MRIVLCKRQALSPSSRRQEERVRSIIQEGAQVRVCDPDNGSKFGVMHAKTWLIDGEIYIGGSSNFTDNSLMNSIENCVVVKQEEFVATYLDWFEGLWARAEDYSQVLAMRAAGRTSTGAP